MTFSLDRKNLHIPLEPSTGNSAEAPPEGREKIRCTIETITYRDDASLYTVLRAMDHDSRHLFTAVGELISCSEGEEFLFEGSWHEHPRYGLQLKIESATPMPPSTLDGIERYLASSGIPGIGKGFARRIVRKFGTKTLQVIEESPARLLKIKGLGRSRLDGIVGYFREREQERAVMLFLYSHGMTPAYAARIYRRYKGDSIDVIRQNPYRLAEEIWGIGFKMADRLAMRLGIHGNAPERLRAAALFMLSEAESEGHCYLTKDQLVSFTTAAIEVDAADVERCLEAMLQSGELVKVASPGTGETFEPMDCIYASDMFSIETEAASRLRTLLARPPHKTARIEIEDEIGAAQTALGITFAPAQREAVVRAVMEKVSIITGGPGTGKTTIVRAIVAIFKKFGKSVFLCAPTGRAAKRLFQATGHKAKTIHRLLRWNAAARTFDFNETNPLACDLLIVDETSMVDIRLFANLLEALKPETRILIVGDADQLPSVGPGSVLRDLLQSDAIASTRLNEIFRQAAASMIISNAHRINRGVMPAFEPEEGQVHDFFFIDRAEPEQIADAVLEMVTSRIPSKYGMNPLRDIQVLTPMHKGRIGVKSLNDMLSAVLNASGRRIQGAAEPISAGDKVMQIRNNYDLDVFNGDIGVVTGLDTEDKKLSVDFDGRLVKYPLESTDDLVKAYAISIHKSQGSEYDAVVVPVSTSHYIMLQRNLIYTAITRAKKLVILIGTKKALAIAVKNDKVRERNTMLARFLREVR